MLGASHSPRWHIGSAINLVSAPGGRLDRLIPEARVYYISVMLPSRSCNPLSCRINHYQVCSTRMCRDDLSQM
jgi:hypothetical protein